MYTYEHGADSKRAKYRNKSTAAIMYHSGASWKLSATDDFVSWQFASSDNADEQAPWDKELGVFSRGWEPADDAHTVPPLAFTGGTCFVFRLYACDENAKNECMYALLLQSRQTYPKS